MNKTQRGRRSQMISRIPKKTTVTVASQKGNSLKICPIIASRGSLVLLFFQTKASVISLILLPTVFSIFHSPLGSDLHQIRSIPRNRHPSHPFSAESSLQEGEGLL